MYYIGYMWLEKTYTSDLIKKNDNDTPRIRLEELWQDSNMQSLDISGTNTYKVVPPQGPRLT